MSLVNSNFSLLALAMSLMVLQEASGAIAMAAAGADAKFSLFPKVTVEISNELPNGATFSIHCKSKDDDLGTHVLGAGQKYSFRFRDKFFESTQFFCGASWNGGHVEFVIYYGSRDDGNRCTHYCGWQARADAVVGFKEGKSNPDLVFPWKK